MIKFISYTHSPSCLCRGVLTLEIDGKKVCFGHNSKDYVSDNKWNDDNYDTFWYTNGSCRFSRKGNPIIETNPWGIDRNKLPKEFQEYSEEIREVFNKNVQWGCCGGCL